MSTSTVIQKVGVLGAGNMGSQIAAHIAAAGFPVVLLDIVNPAEPGDTDLAGRVTCGTFDNDLPLLAACDWIIEAVTENIEIKRALLNKVNAVRREGSIITTNTSGISIRELAAGMPEEFRRHFLGTHFFNPPRFMRLLELIPTAETDEAVTQMMATFADIRLGKTVVRAKDTPNFIGNRVWMFVALTTVRLMQEMGLTVEDIDALTGVPLGWPKTATFRLCDLIGIDVIAHMSERADTASPEFMREMVKRGWLGDKAGQGFYKRPGLVLDWKTLEYRPAKDAEFPVPPKFSPNLRPLLEGTGKPGAFYNKLLPEIWNYVAARVPEISDDIVSVDEAMKAGFNWRLGPFEMWDAAGRVPSWYKDGQYFDPITAQYKPVPVPAGVSSVAAYKKRNGVVSENASISLVDLGDGIGCLEFHTKMNALDADILALATEVLESGKQFDGFVLASDAPNFSAGANLVRFLDAIRARQWSELDAMIRAIQRMTQAIKFCPRPVVAASVGHTLGGGAEVALHAARRQAHSDVRIGLVEAAVGLVPAGGGCKEMVLRSPDVSQTFANIVLARSSRSASEARRMHYLSEKDNITMNRVRLLEDAKQCVLHLVEEGYAAPAMRSDIPVPQLQTPDLPITGHDLIVAKHIADILSGGHAVSGTLLTEQNFLDLERQAFLSLCGEQKTEERIAQCLRRGNR